MKLALGFKGERFIYLPISILSIMDKNPLTGDLYIYSLGYFTKAAHHYFNRPQGCDQFLLIYCKEGCGQIQVNNINYTLMPNQFIILPPNIKHQYQADKSDPWSIYWLHFKGEKAQYYADGLDKPIGLKPSQDSEIEECLNLFEKMYITLKGGFGIENINYANACLNHFLSSLLYQNQYKRDNTTSKSEYKECIINWAIYYMHENINKSLTLKDISSYANYSTSYFYRKFIKETGIAPLAYFTLMKIDKACHLLTNTNMQINQIASLLGYSDPLYFSRVFTKIKKIPPRKYMIANNKYLKK